MTELRNRDRRVGLINLSRNFGKELAMTAGLDQATGDAVVVIDADLQDPPELIPNSSRNGARAYDVVYGKRTSRAGESALKKATAFLFYRLIQKDESREDSRRHRRLPPHEPPRGRCAAQGCANSIAS